MLGAMDSLTPQTPNDTTQLARELLHGLNVEEKKRRNRPLLIAWSLRMEIGLHRDLQALSKSSGFSMTAIFCTALKLTMPTLKAILQGQSPLPVEGRVVGAPEAQRRLQIPTPTQPPPTPASKGIWGASASTFTR